MRFEQSQVRRSGWTATRQTDFREAHEQGEQTASPSSQGLLCALFSDSLPGSRTSAASSRLAYNTPLPAFVSFLLFANTAAYWSLACVIVSFGCPCPRPERSFHPRPEGWRAV